MPDWLAEVRSRLAGLRLSPSRIDEIADEVAQHVEDRYDELVASGRPPADAEAAAWREFDAPHVLARAVLRAERSALNDVPASVTRGQRLMGRLINDIRLGVRSLRRPRSGTALAVLAFALGIGITTAVFSVFYSVLLKPLPYPDADRMVVVYDVQPACGTCPASFTKYVDWRTRNNVFEDIALISNRWAVVTGQGDAERLYAALATWTVPAVFKTSPMMGRWFTEQEDVPSGEKVVVLNNAYWIDRFASDPNAIGRSVTIDGEPYKVIGVMPPDFQRTAQMFRPVQLAPNPGLRGNHGFPAYARLKPGVTVAQAQKDMVALGNTLAQEFGHNHGIDVQSYPQRVLGNITQPLRMLMGAVSFVLLIACANIANLLLAAGASRKREYAVRAAIGATRWDLARQVLTESVILSVVGGTLGLLLAQAAVRVFAKLADTIVPRASAIAIDTNVLLFAGALSVFTGVLCALWPMLRLDVRALAAVTRENDQRSGGDAASRRFGHSLVVAEIALAFSLLVGSGLFLKNLIGLQHREIGFATQHIIAFDLPTTGTKYKTPEQIRAFYDQALPQFAAIPRVQQSGATTHLPMYNFGWNGEVSLEGGNPWPATSAPLVERAWIDGDYFSTLNIKVLQGRAFDKRDSATGEPVTMITKRTAEKFWPGQNAVGRRMQEGSQPSANTPWRTVVGVIDDVRSFGLDQAPPYQMFLPAVQQPFGPMTIVMRVAGDDPAVVMPDVRRVVKGLDSSLPIAKVQTLETVVANTVNLPRLFSALTSLFGALAGLLAAVGVYGVMAYNVRRDRRQFAIRLALGADPSRVRRLILMRGVVLGAAGIAIGGVGAYWLSNFAKTQLSDVQATDPWVFGASALVLFVVAVGACARPAFQAAKTDPMGALRGE